MTPELSDAGQAIVDRLTEGGWTVDWERLLDGWLVTITGVGARREGAGSTPGEALAAVTEAVLP